MQIVVFSYSSVNTKSQAALVLGASIVGNTPTLVFQQRIDHAIGLYQQGRVEHLIFTGGVGEQKQMAESEVARDYAISKGVQADRIHIEKESRTTLENLKFAKPIIEQNQWHAVLLVSDPLHMKRASVMALDLGIRTYPSPTETSQYKSWHSKSKFLLRETYFYLYYWLTGK